MMFHAQKIFKLSICFPVDSIVARLGKNKIPVSGGEIHRT